MSRPALRLLPLCFAISQAVVAQEAEQNWKLQTGMSFRHSHWIGMVTKSEEMAPRVMDRDGDCG